jgi:hypothetical protein
VGQRRTLAGRLLWLVAAMALLGVGTLRADVVLPTTITVWFEQQAQPYRRPVSFTVRCYGWWSHPGHAQGRPEPYLPQEVFTLTGQCPDYGCRLHDALYLNYRHIDYCDLEGQSDGRRFQIKRYGSHPMTRCQESGAGGGTERRCELRLAIPDR